MSDSSVPKFSGGSHLPQGINESLAKRNEELPSGLYFVSRHGHEHKADSRKKKIGTAKYPPGYMHQRRLSFDPQDHKKYMHQKSVLECEDKQPQGFTEHSH